LSERRAAALETAGFGTVDLVDGVEPQVEIPDLVADDGLGVDEAVCQYHIEIAFAGLGFAGLEGLVEDCVAHYVDGGIGDFLVGNEVVHVI
jgi:hypothetical protein